MPKSDPVGGQAEPSDRTRVSIIKKRGGGRARMEEGGITGRISLGRRSSRTPPAVTSIATGPAFCDLPHAGASERRVGSLYPPHLVPAGSRRRRRGTFQAKPPHAAAGAAQAPLGFGAQTAARLPPPTACHPADRPPAWNATNSQAGHLNLWSAEATKQRRASVRRMSQRGHGSMGGNDAA
jgi:hypothetical protein